MFNFSCLTSILDPNPSLALSPISSPCTFITLLPLYFSIHYRTLFLLYFLIPLSYASFLFLLSSTLYISGSFSFLVLLSCAYLFRLYFILTLSSQTFIFVPSLSTYKTSISNSTCSYCQCCDSDSAFSVPRHIFHNPHIANEWLIDVTDWLNDWLHLWTWRRASRQDRIVNSDRTTRGTWLFVIMLIALDLGHRHSGKSGNM